MHHVHIQRPQITCALHGLDPPTRSLGISRSSEPCFMNTLPAVCCGLMPTPSASVSMHLKVSVGSHVSPAHQMPDTTAHNTPTNGRLRGT